MCIEQAFATRHIRKVSSADVVRPTTFTEIGRKNCIVFYCIMGKKERERSRWEGKS